MKTLKSKLILIGVCAMLFGANNVQAQQARWSNSAQESASARDYCINQEQVICAAELALTLANGIFQFVDTEMEYVPIFLPIVTAANDFLDAYYDLGAWASETKTALNDFITLVKSKDTQIKSFLKTPYHNKLARQLKSVIRVIENEMK